MMVEMAEVVMGQVVEVMEGAATEAARVAVVTVAVVMGSGRSSTRESRRYEVCAPLPAKPTLCASRLLPRSET